MRSAIQRDKSEDEYSHEIRGRSQGIMEMYTQGHLFNGKYFTKTGKIDSALRR